MTGARNEDPGSGRLGVLVPASLFVVVLASRLPFLGPGYGSDSDTRGSSCPRRAIWPRPVSIFPRARRATRSSNSHTPCCGGPGFGVRSPAAWPRRSSADWPRWSSTGSPRISCRGGALRGSRSSSRSRPACTSRAVRSSTTCGRCRFCCWRSGTRTAGGCFAPGSSAGSRSASGPPPGSSCFPWACWPSTVRRRAAGCARSRAWCCRRSRWRVCASCHWSRTTLTTVRWTSACGPRAICSLQFACGSRSASSRSWPGRPWPSSASLPGLLSAPPRSRPRLSSPRSLASSRSASCSCPSPTSPAIWFRRFRCSSWPSGSCWTAVRSRSLEC